MPRKGKGKDFERPHLDEYLQSVTFKEFITAMGENRPIIMIFTNTAGNVKSVVYKEVMPGKFNTPKPMDTIGMKARAVIENLMNKEREPEVAEPGLHREVAEETIAAFQSDEAMRRLQQQADEVESRMATALSDGLETMKEESQADDGNVHVGTWVEFEDSNGSTAQGRVEIIAPDESTFSIRRRDDVLLVVNADKLLAIVPNLTIERQPDL